MHYVGYQHSRSKPKPHEDGKRSVFWFFALLAFASSWWPLGVLFVLVAAVIHILRAQPK